jgi:hypothetical protein
MRGRLLPRRLFDEFARGKPLVVAHIFLETAFIERGREGALFHQSVQKTISYHRCARAGFARRSAATMDASNFLLCAYPE